MVNSTIIFSNNAKKKEQLRYQSVSNKVDEGKPYARFKSATNMTKMAHIMLEDQLSLSEKYTNIKISPNEWLVRRDWSNNNYVVHHVHPTFVRIHRVIYKHGQLHCSCPFPLVYGLLCCHMIHVATSICPEYDINHHDISCVWWMNYHQREYVKDSEKIGRYFKLLQKKDSIGIRISEEFVDKTPIYGGPIPEDFRIDDNMPKCVNYPSQAYKDELLMEQNNRGIPGNMSQTSQFHNFDDTSDTLEIDTLDEDIDNLFQQYINQSEQDEEIINPEDDPIRNPFKFLKHSYNEMIESLKNNTTIEELYSIQRFLYSKTSQAFERHYININGTESNNKSRSSIVSSNVGCCKRRKTHGTKPHWANR